MREEYYKDDLWTATTENAVMEGAVMEGAVMEGSLARHGKGYGRKIFLYLAALFLLLALVQSWRVHSMQQQVRRTQDELTKVKSQLSELEHRNNMQEQVIIDLGKKESQ